MHDGDYVEHRLTKARGTVMEIRDQWVTIYSPNLGPLNELWFAPEEELSRILTKEENARVQELHRVCPV